LEKDKSYIQDLFKKVQFLFEQKKEVYFTIVEGKNKGFLVKVSGLYAYVPYQFMPWRYFSLSNWQNLANSLNGKTFKGSISQLEEAPIRIVIDARKQTFKAPELSSNHKYKGMVIQRAEYGLFVELGMHFDWKHGSMVGLLHKSVFREPLSFAGVVEGREIIVTFQGYNKEGKMILGEIWEEAKWLTKEIEEFVGTKQEVTVMSIDGKKVFFVKGVHKAIAPITKLWYPNDKGMAKEYKNNLQDGQVIYCEVLKISKRKDCFVIRLPVISR